MYTKLIWLSLLATLGATLTANAQYTDTDYAYKRWSVGSTIFILGNFSTTDPPNFAQLNVGYRITGKDVVALEAKTWKYSWPNGIHPFFNKAYGKQEEKFPGYVREYGISLVYQRFLWKGLYSELNVMPTWQTFSNEEGDKLKNGFQVFNTYRVGYHIKLFKDRLFIQPSLAITHRPYHTKLPATFKELDAKWSRFVFGEPGFHFGYNLR